jgi:hypothetical protein
MDGDAAALHDGPLQAAYRDCEGLPADLDARVIGARVLELPQHAELLEGGAAIDYLFRVAEKRRKGRRVLGMCIMPAVQGDLADLFDHLLTATLGRFPDFLIVLDWTYWCEATLLQREILVFHELKHARQATDRLGAPRFNREGMPVWTTVDHDVSVFHDEARRYGAHDTDLARLVEALHDHDDRDGGATD